LNLKKSQILYQLSLATTILSTTTSKYTTLTSTGTTSPCILGVWGAWSPCPSECQPDRYQKRSRIVISGTCFGPLHSSNLCDQTPCQQCTITREDYRRTLGHAPLGDSEFS
jgi:hypothetical protein